MLDGRSGLDAADAAGFTLTPVRVIDDVRDLKTREIVEVTPEVEVIYEKLAREKDPFDKQMEAFAESHGGIYKDTNLKGRGRAMEKIRDDYAGDPNEIKDILRGTIVVNTLADVESVLNSVLGIYKPWHQQVKMGLLEANSFNLGGYKDVNLVVKLENGMKAEVQINTREMVVAKHWGHDLYVAYRSTKNQIMKRAMQEVEMKLYRDAYALARKNNGMTDLDEALGVVKARIDDVNWINDQYDTSINFSKSDLDTILPLWAADPQGNFRGGTVSHAKQAVFGSSLSMSNVTGMPSTKRKLMSMGKESKSRNIESLSTAPTSVDLSTTSIARMGSQRGGTLFRRGDSYDSMSGRDLDYQVRVESTGEVATLTVDAATAMQEVDARIEALEELRRCI